MANQEYLLELFHNLIKKMKKEWSSQLVGSSPAQYQILKRLACAGSVKAAELAEGIQITPGAITGAADKLVAAGYAARRRDETDRRVVYLEITADGRQYVDQLNAQFKHVTAKFFAGLPQEDIDHLIRIYAQIARNLDTTPPAE